MMTAKNDSNTMLATHPTAAKAMSTLAQVQVHDAVHALVGVLSVVTTVTDD